MSVLPYIWWSAMLRSNPGDTFSNSDSQAGMRGLTLSQTPRYTLCTTSSQAQHFLWAEAWWRSNQRNRKKKKLKPKNPLKYPNHLDANWGLTHPTTCAFISSQAWNMLLNKKFVLTTCLKQKWNSDVTGCNNSQI